MEAIIRGFPLHHVAGSPRHTTAREAYREYRYGSRGLHLVPRILRGPSDGVFLPSRPSVLRGDMEVS
jgi:hypothetical protein